MAEQIASDLQSRFDLGGDMTLVGSPLVRRLSAVGLLLLAIWLVFRVVGLYASERAGMAAERREAQRNYHDVLDRRVDITVLQRQLSLLNSSERARQLTIEAPNDRGALIKLQQIARSAVEESKGKLLSAIEFTADQQPGTIALLVRARIAEQSLPQLMSNLENGNPRVGVDEISLALRSTRAGEQGDVEMTATLRGRWLAPSRIAP